MEKSGAKAYLVNTGWNGTGKRISIKDTRGIIDAILGGDILTAPTKKLPIFNFEIPTELPGVDPKILDPRDTYANPEEWTKKAEDLAARFIKNFESAAFFLGWAFFGVGTYMCLRVPKCVSMYRHFLHGCYGVVGILILLN